MTPEDIVFREVESDSVVIQWTVAYISYSPETYVVQYGTSRETLVHNSSRRASEVGTTTYSVSLSGLRDNTTYYVYLPNISHNPCCMGYYTFEVALTFLQLTKQSSMAFFICFIFLFF